MIFLNGAGGATIKEQLPMLTYPHDIINFFENPASSNFDDFLRLYQKGLSLREISEASGFSRSTIRDLLVLNKVPLRTNKKTTTEGSVKPQRAFWGAIPYGYTPLDGKLVIDPKEIKIVRKILVLHQKGTSFNAISIFLNNQKIPSKLGKRWSDKTVASIIRKHPSNKTEGDYNG
jgi:hypothetical protein